MANWIYVCGRSSTAITYGELEDYMGHMGFLDEPASFDPPLDESNASDPGWGSFRLSYRAEKRPIVVRHWVTSEELEPTLAEVRERVQDDLPKERADVILQSLSLVQQAIVFEIPDDLPQDVWEMLDATETFIAKKCDGFVVADEGVFDANLKPILMWSHH